MSPITPDGITAATRVTPESSQNPGLAMSSILAARSDLEAIDNTIATAHATNLVAQRAAYQRAVAHHGEDNVHRALGWAGGLVGKGFHQANAAFSHVPGHTYAGKALSATPLGALNSLGKGLREVQHDYRYLHDVESRHGKFPAFLESLGIGLGAVAGTIIDQPVAGGAAVGWVQAHAFYRDSYDRTEHGDSYLDPSTHKTVSFGRDIGHILGLKGSAFTVASGAGDAFFGLADPLVIAGNLGKSYRVAGKVVDEGTAAERLVAGKSLLGNEIIGRGYRRAEDVDRALAARPDIARAVDHLSTLSSGEVAAHYPQLAKVGLAGELGRATTPTAVADVFKAAITNENLGTGLLPTRTRIGGRLADTLSTVRQYEGPGSSIIRRQSLTPVEWDAKTKQLSQREWNPGADTGIPVFLNTERIYKPERWAQDAATKFADAPLPRRIQMYKDSLLSAVQARAGSSLDDPERLQIVKNLIDDSLGGTAAGRTGYYGFDMAGRDLSKIITDTGETLAAGTADNHVGKIAMIQLGDINHLANQLKGAEHLWTVPGIAGRAGLMDDWVYKNLTRPFKTAALSTLGFAQRVSSAELITAVLRHPKGIVEARINTAAARLSVKLAENEDSHVTAALLHAFRGSAKLLRADPADIESITEMILTHDGQLVHPALDAGHDISPKSIGTDEVANRTFSILMNHTNSPLKPTGAFEPISGLSDRATTAWEPALHEFANDKAMQAGVAKYAETYARTHDVNLATQAALADVHAQLLSRSPKELSIYSRSTASSTPGVDPILDFAKVKLENFKGLTHSPDGTPIQSLLDAFVAKSRGAKGDATLANTAFSKAELDKLPPELRPINIKGQVLTPVIPENPLKAVQAKGWHVLDHIINFWAREPIYVESYLREYKPFRAMVARGEISAEDAAVRAETAAVISITPHIHNLTERSQFSVLAHNFMPFWFAQEQAYKRVGRLLETDPHAFARYQQVLAKMHEIGHESTDASGNKYFTYPGSGYLGKYTPIVLSALGIPMANPVATSYSGDMSSFQSVFPFTEGIHPNFGPFVTIPAHLFANFDPAAKPLLDTAVGKLSMSGGIWDQLLPNTAMRQTVKAFQGTSSSFNNSMIATIQDLSYQQQQLDDTWTAKGGSLDDVSRPHVIPLPGSGPRERQVFIDRIRNQTRVNFLMKAALSLVSPASPQLNIGNMGLKSELSADIAKHGYSKGVDVFLRANPDATAYTIAKTKSNIGGALQAIPTAEKWLKSHTSLITAYPDAASWLIPQHPGDAYNQSVYNDQLAQHFRVRKTPAEFYNNFYISAGNASFYDVDKPAYDAALKSALDSGDEEGAANLRSNWSSYIQTLGAQNPIWFDNFTSSERSNYRKRAITQLDQLFAAKLAPPSTQTKLVRGILTDYHTFQNGLSAGRSDSWAADERKVYIANWQSYLDDKSKSDPALRPIINKLFRQV